MPARRELERTFVVLKALLAPYQMRLHPSQDTPTSYVLDGGYNPEFKRPMAFAAVQIRRAFVAFTLAPVYSHPEILSRISDPLRKHFHGRSSFTFVHPERELLTELSALVERGFDLYERLGWLK